MSKRAVFLDRDGTLIEDVGFVRRVEDVKLRPEAAAAVARLNRAGWAVVVVTNQSGVARGLLTEADVAATNQRMMDLLAKQDARVDAIYYCPHLPEGKVTDYAVVCGCRKPRPGMILKAAQDFDIDLARSVTIGDAPRDVEAGLAAGTRAILLTQSATRAERAPDACGQASDLTAAVEEILQLDDAPPAPVVAEKAAPAFAEASAGKPAPEPVEAPAEAEPPREIPIHAAPKEFVPEPEVEPRAAEKKPKSRAKEKPAEPVEAVVVEPPKPAPDAQSGARLRRVPHQQETAPTPACGRCGRAVQQSDIDAGRAFGRDGIYLCETCAGAVAARRRAVEKDVAASSEEIVRELQDIKRALTFRHFSPWHVLGSVAQALAIGSIVVGYAARSGLEGLLWAIFFQVLALTLFVLGRM